jgi:hypothetical protein
MSAQKTDSSAAAAEAMTEMTQPIIVDLGRQKSAQIKDLKAGEGELWDEVLDVVDEVKEMLGAEANGKVLVPLVMIYEKKSALPRLEKVLFPLADWDAEDEDEDEEDD